MQVVVEISPGARAKMSFDFLFYRLNSFKTDEIALVEGNE